MKEVDLINDSSETNPIAPISLFKAKPVLTVRRHIRLKPPQSKEVKIIA